MLSPEGYTKLNKSALAALRRALDDEPSADLEQTLHRIYTSYSTFRSNMEKRETNPREKKPSVSVVAPVKQIFGAKIPKSLQLTVPSYTDTLGASTRIISPLKPEVTTFLSIGENICNPSTITKSLLAALAIPEPLMNGVGRMVIPLGDKVVVKLMKNVDNIAEHEFLSFLQDQLPSIPAPRPLGYMTIGPYSCMFMTRLPGEPLERLWPDLQEPQKQVVRSLLDDILSTLRSVELPTGQAMGSVQPPHRCKDCRRNIRTSTDPIYNESQFNEFLTPESDRVASGYRTWLCSLLRTDHRIVLTHGDFHPRNIIVDVSSTSGEISVGLVDWEMAGYYPEYWEMLKALNCRYARDTSDWWEHLPRCILGYDQEVIVDGTIEHWLLP